VASSHAAFRSSGSWARKELDGIDVHAEVRTKSREDVVLREREWCRHRLHAWRGLGRSTPGTGSAGVSSGDGFGKLEVVKGAIKMEVAPAALL
jgi:hypothetical protein